MKGCTWDVADEANLLLCVLRVGLVVADEAVKEKVSAIIRTYPQICYV